MKYKNKSSYKCLTQVTKIYLYRPLGVLFFMCCCVTACCISLKSRDSQPLVELTADLFSLLVELTADSVFTAGQVNC